MMIIICEMGNIVFLGAICVDTNAVNNGNRSPRRRRGRRREFVDIRLSYFEGMETISRFLYEIQRVPARSHPDARVESTPRGRAIFESLRFSAKNHIPRLRGLAWRLTQDCEQLVELTLRDDFSYKELCNLAQAIKDQADLGEIAMNIATEHVIREQQHKNNDSTRGGDSSSPQSIRIWEAMVEEMNSLLEVMQDYYRNALDNVAIKAAEVSREREAEKQRKLQRKLQRKRQKTEEGKVPEVEDEAEDEDEDEDEDEEACLLCCNNKPLGTSDSWVECPHCIDQVAKCVCWDCTLRIFKENDARCPFCGGENELLVVGNFK